MYSLLVQKLIDSKHKSKHKTKSKYKRDKGRWFLLDELVNAFDSLNYVVSQVKYPKLTWWKITVAVLA